jgi:uncharacterized protein YfiM (DUF2279 family)
MKKLLAILLILLLCLISLTVFCQETMINKNQKAIDLRLGLGITGVMAVYSLAPITFSDKYQVETDKIYHFCAGAIISGIGTSLGYRITKNNNIACLFGFSCGLGAGFAKEYLWDKAIKHKNASQNDIIATGIGSAFGAFTISAVISLNHDKKPLKRYD